MRNEGVSGSESVGEGGREESEWLRKGAWGGRERNGWRVREMEGRKRYAFITTQRGMPLLLHRPYYWHELVDIYLSLISRLMCLLPPILIRVLTCRYYYTGPTTGTS